MTESSRLPLFDLRKLNASLPVPSIPESSVRVLVVGAKDDFIVVLFLVFYQLLLLLYDDIHRYNRQKIHLQDAKGLDETGKFYGVTPVCVDGVAHDMILDCEWEKGANAILSWLTTLETVIMKVS